MIFRVLRLSRVAFVKAPFFQKSINLTTRSFSSTVFRFNDTSRYIVEIDETNFQSELLGSQLPVLVDLYADWCVPCKTLSPLLESVILSRKNVKLVKINIDKYPEIAEQFQVESVPTIFGLIGTQIVAKHVGMMKEDEITAMCDKLISAVNPQSTVTEVGKPPLEDLLKSAQQLFLAQKTDEALTIYEQIIGNEGLAEIHPKAYSGVAMCMLTKGQIENAEGIVKALKEKFPEWEKDAEIKVVVNMVDIYGLVGTTFRPLEELEANIAKNPADFDSRFEISAQLFVNAPGLESKKRAVEELLTIIKKNKNFKEGKAKILIRKYFDVLGEGELVKKYRQRLASMLF